MRNIGLFITRVIFGSYLAVHGAQKLFGSFEGHGLEATGAGFHSLGLQPGKLMATVAGASGLPPPNRTTITQLLDCPKTPRTPSATCSQWSCGVVRYCTK
jgi:uncharacterized membrane protein YphA (DoxX/SURF4 family)